MIQYAVNVADLDRYRDDMTVRWLLVPVLDSRTVNAEPKMVDGMAALLNCSEDQAKSIIWWLWNKAGYRSNLLRFYRTSTRGSGWVRVKPQDVADV